MLSVHLHTLACLVCSTFGVHHDVLSQHTEDKELMTTPMQGNTLTPSSHSHHMITHLHPIPQRVNKRYSIKGLSKATPTSSPSESSSIGSAPYLISSITMVRCPWLKGRGGEGGEGREKWRGRDGEGRRRGVMRNMFETTHHISYPNEDVHYLGLWRSKLRVIQV